MGLCLHTACPCTISPSVTAAAYLLTAAVNRYKRWMASPHPSNNE